MPMKTKSKKPPRRLRGSMTDASRLRNPYARPRRICSWSVIDNSVPIRVVDRRAERLEPLLLLLTSEPMVTGPRCGRHSIIYRCRYRHWAADRELHERDVYADSPAAAIERLRQRMIGFNVSAIEIFAIRPPLTREQVVDIKAANAAMDAERRQLGICGDGEPWQKAIEAWLSSTEPARDRDLADEPPLFFRD
jgi:hypothetical protein